MAKRFAYVSFGILCLVAAYQLGARSTQAQTGGGLFVGGGYSPSIFYGVTSGGDIWSYSISQGGTQYIGTFDTGGPVSVTDRSFGEIKSFYRE